MKKRIKLLHVTSSMKIGGAENLLCDLVRKLGNESFEHHVVYFHNGPNLKKIKDCGAKTYYVSGFVCLYDPCFFIRLFCVIKKINPDVVHSLLWSANIASRLVVKILKKPLVSVYHSHINDSFFRFSIDKITRGLADINVAVSESVASSLGKSFLFRPTTCIRVISNGIDFNYINASEHKWAKRAELDLFEDDFVIGAVGRLHPVKNFPLLLTSFSLISSIRKNIKLVIVGVGPLENELQELSCRLGIKDRVRFVVGKQAYNYYSLFDCFVQSSLHEGLSIALLEAMSFELPCIVTGKGVHPVIKNQKNGIIVESENQSMLCSALLSILDDKVFAKNIAKKAKSDVVKRFSVEKMVSQYKFLFFLLYKNYSNGKIKRKNW